MYQVEISVADVTAAGYDNSDGTSGITTIRVKHGNLHLELPAAGRPGQGLQELGGREPVFAGDLRGSGNTVWFVYRPDLTAKLTGCLLPASGTLAGHCLPGDP